MADFLAAYSVQHWLESVPQGYLMGREFGHLPGETEPAALGEDGPLREATLRTTAFLLGLERTAMEAASGLLSLAPDDPTRRFLATQVLDDARHVEIFAQRLRDLGLDRTAVGSLTNAAAVRALTPFAERIRQRLQRRDFAGALLGSALILSSFRVHLFEELEQAAEKTNPKLAHMLAGALADARRHLAFGEVRLDLLLRESPRRRAALERLRPALSRTLLAAVGEAFAPDCAERDPSREATAGPDGPAALEDRLTRAVERELRIRLARLGLA